MTFQFNYAPPQKAMRTFYYLLAFAGLGLLVCAFADMEFNKMVMLAVLCVALLGIMAWLIALFKEKENGSILIIDRQVIIPHSWKSGVMDIDIDSITDVTAGHADQHGHMSLKIHYDLKVATLPYTWFDSTSDLSVFVLYLNKMMEGDPFDQYEKDAYVTVRASDIEPPEA